LKKSLIRAKAILAGIYLQSQLALFKVHSVLSALISMVRGNSESAYVTYILQPKAKYLVILVSDFTVSSILLA
jgi:hypothetical protein